MLILPGITQSQWHQLHTYKVCSIYIYCMQLCDIAWFLVPAVASSSEHVCACYASAIQLLKSLELCYECTGGGGWSPYTKQWAQKPIQKSMTSQVRLPPYRPPLTKQMPPHTQTNASIYKQWTHEEKDGIHNRTHSQGHTLPFSSPLPDQYQSSCSVFAVYNFLLGISMPQWCRT